MYIYLKASEISTYVFIMTFWGISVIGRPAYSVYDTSQPWEFFCPFSSTTLDETGPVRAVTMLW